MSRIPAEAHAPVIAQQYHNGASAVNCPPLRTTCLRGKRKALIMKPDNITLMSFIVVCRAIEITVKTGLVIIQYQQVIHPSERICRV